MYQILKSDSWKKIMLISAVTLLPVAAGKLLLPLDWFAFRCQEGARDTRRFLCGAEDYSKNFFKKNSYCRNTRTQGALAPHTRYSSRWDEEWFTDDLGFRNKDASPDKRYQVVIVGDSDIEGAGVTQEDMINVKLGKMIGANVYSWAPDSLVGMLYSKRFQEAPPFIVVVAENEKNTPFWRVAWMLNLIRAHHMNERTPSSASPGCRVYKHFPEKLQLFLSDVYRKPLLPRFLFDNAVTWLFKKQAPETVLNERTGNYFDLETLHSLRKAQQTQEALVPETVTALKSFNAMMRQKGMLMIYMPIPAKWSIYWDQVPEDIRKELRRPDYLTSVISELDKAGILTIDLTRIFRDAYEREGRMLHWPDDNHMHAQGAQLVAEVLQNKIASLQSRSPKPD